MQVCGTASQCCRLYSGEEEGTAKFQCYQDKVGVLPPPSDDRIEELKKYQDRMGYTEESMRSMRYKMSVYDDFTEEYDYRVKYNRNHSSEEQLKAQAEQQIITPVRRRGRGR